MFTMISERTDCTLVMWQMCIALASLIVMAFNVISKKRNKSVMSSSKPMMPACSNANTGGRRHHQQLATTFDHLDLAIGLSASSMSLFHCQQHSKFHCNTFVDWSTCVVLVRDPCGRIQAKSPSCPPRQKSRPLCSATVRRPLDTVPCVSCNKQNQYHEWPNTSHCKTSSAGSQTPWSARWCRLMGY